MKSPTKKLKTYGIELDKKESEEMEYWFMDQLIAFGEYVLSEKRRNRIMEYEEYLREGEKLKTVYHADLENFKAR